VILWRLLPWRADASPKGSGGALWFPRELQGAGRHDNPDRYGCLYASETPLSAVAEALAPFRGTGVLSSAMLLRAGLPLALAQLELDEGDPDAGGLLDLDDPAVLLGSQLRPSQVATGARAVTQAYARRIFDETPEALGLRWWSTLEASLLNVTLYDRALPRLSCSHVEPLALGHPAIQEAAEMLGLIVTSRGSQSA
jgi:hypothetical protein